MGQSKFCARMLIPAIIAILCGLAGASVPKISYNDLLRVDQEQSLLDLLRDDGGRIGAFAVTDIPVAGYGDQLSDLLNRAKDCIGRNETLPAIDLSSRSMRRTYATEDNVYPKCMSWEAGIISQAFDLIGAGVSEAIEAVYGDNLFYTRPEGIKRQLADAPHKDHIHFYEQTGPSTPHARGNAETFLVPEHTDNGIFLMITPFPEQSLVVRTSTGRKISTADLDPSNTVLVLMGVAMPNWLLQGDSAAVRNQFHPVPHSVPHIEQRNSERTVFARMKVAPGDSVPITRATEHKHAHDSDLLTFEDVFVQKSPSYPVSSESGLCSVHLESERYQRAVRDQCEEEGTAYCWHDCMDIPQNCTEEIIENGGMVCLDVIDGVECDPDIHSPNCALVCFETREDNNY